MQHVIAVAMLTDPALYTGSKPAAQSSSIIAATDSNAAILQARQRALKLRFGALVAAGGDQPTSGIAAPSAGQRIVITQLIVQNHGAEAVTVQLKHGAADTDAITIRCPGGDLAGGIAEVYPLGSEWRLPDSTAFLPNISAAGSLYVGGYYYLEDTLTGLPV